jgi:hypothetical protein
MRNARPSEADEWPKHNEPIPHEEVLAEFGLTLAGSWTERAKADVRGELLFVFDKRYLHDQRGLQKRLYRAPLENGKLQGTFEIERDPSADPDPNAGGQQSLFG